MCNINGCYNVLFWNNDKKSVHTQYTGIFSLNISDPHLSEFTGVEPMDAEITNTEGQHYIPFYGGLKENVPQRE